MQWKPARRNTHFCRHIQTQATSISLSTTILMAISYTRGAIFRRQRKNRLLLFGLWELLNPYSDPLLQSHRWIWNNTSDKHRRSRWFIYHFAHERESKVSISQFILSRVCLNRFQWVLWRCFFRSTCDVQARQSVLWLFFCCFYYIFTVCGLWFRVCGLRFAVCGFWFLVCGLWFVVYGLLGFS